MNARDAVSDAVQLERYGIAGPRAAGFIAVIERERRDADLLGRAREIIAAAAIDPVERVDILRALARIDRRGERALWGPR